MYLNEILLIASLSCYRLWLLKKPLTVRLSISALNVRIYLFFLFVLSIGIISYHLGTGDVARFEPTMLSCIPDRVVNDSAGYILGKWMAFPILPMLLIIVTNVFIIYFERKQSKSLNKSALSALAMRCGVPFMPQTSEAVAKRTKFTRSNQSTFVTIAIVGLVFFLSYVPMFVYKSFQAFLYSSSTWFSVFTICSLSLNIAANPLIYMATNKAFRNFLIPKGWETSVHGMIKRSREGFLSLTTTTTSSASGVTSASPEQQSVARDT